MKVSSFFLLFFSEILGTDWCTKITKGLKVVVGLTGHWQMKTKAKSHPKQPASIPTLATDHSFSLYYSHSTVVSSQHWQQIIHFLCIIHTLQLSHPNTGNRSFIFSVLFTLYSCLIPTLATDHSFSLYYSHSTVVSSQHWQQIIHFLCIIHTLLLSHPNTGNRSFIFSVLFTLYSCLISTSPFTFGTKYKFHHKYLTTFYLCTKHLHPSNCANAPEYAQIFKGSNDDKRSGGGGGGTLSPFKIVCFETLLWPWNHVQLSHNNFFWGNLIFMQTDETTQTEWNNCQEKASFTLLATHSLANGTTGPISSLQQFKKDKLLSVCWSGVLKMHASCSASKTSSPNAGGSRKKSSFQPSDKVKTTAHTHTHTHTCMKLHTWNCPATKTLHSGQRLCIPTTSTMNQTNEPQTNEDYIPIIWWSL